MHLESDPQELALGGKLRVQVKALELCAYMYLNSALACVPYE